MPGAPEPLPVAPELGGVRRLTARGVAINSAFQVGLGALNLLKALIAAALPDASDYGVWGMLVLALALVVAAEEGRRRRQVHPAGRARPGARLPEGVHARAARTGAAC